MKLQARRRHAAEAGRVEAHVSREPQGLAVEHGHHGAGRSGDHQAHLAELVFPVEAGDVDAPLAHREAGQLRLSNRQGMALDAQVRRAPGPGQRRQRLVKDSRQVLKAKIEADRFRREPVARHRPRGEIDVEARLGYHSAKEIAPHPLPRRAPGLEPRRGSRHR